VTETVGQEEMKRAREPANLENKAREEGESFGGTYTHLWGAQRDEIDCPGQSIPSRCSGASYEKPHFEKIL